MDNPIFIGVDGGGTGCRAVIGTRSIILGTGRGGPANVSSDMVSALKNIHLAIKQAMVGLDEFDMRNTYAHIGLAGVLTSAQAGAVKADLPFAKIVVTDDRATSIAGALGADDGIVAAIGTGSFIGSKRHDTFQFVGGWGLMLSDEASGAWLGRTVLAETLLAQDGMRAKTGLTREISALHQNDPNTIVAFAATATPADLGTFARYVTDAAGTGDGLAIDLLQRGANYIELALTVLNPQPEDTLCLVGGLGPTYAGFLAVEFTDNLRPTKGSALDGALMLARRMA
jgi:glucosamine kinase